MVGHQESDIKGRTSMSRVGHQEWEISTVGHQGLDINVRHQESDIKGRTSRVRHKGSDIKGRTWSDINVGHKGSDINFKGRTSRVGDINGRTSRVGHQCPTSRVGHQGSDIKSRT